MFTGFAGEQALLDPIMAGAAGYVLKQIRGSDLAGAVRAAGAMTASLDRAPANRTGLGPC